MTVQAFYKIKTSWVLGLVIGVLGAVLGSAEPGMAIEEAVGLPWLFHMRGPLAPPSGVAVINADRDSAKKLGQRERLSDWSRAKHADLIDKLVGLGAAVIVFDIFFREQRDAPDEAVLVKVIGSSGRVILTQSAEPHAGIEPKIDLIPPAGNLAEASAGLAPFPLPKVPNRVDQFWAFFSSQEVPTLPVVALQLQVIRSLGYDRFLELLEQAGVSGLPTELRDADDLRELMHLLRGYLVSSPALVANIPQKIAADKDYSTEAKRLLLHTLIGVYSSRASHFLNFYGPPHTITTIPYSAILEQAVSRQDESTLDLRGKVVFVGKSELSNTAQKDGFYTVFSREDGVHLSGVEIAATAYANLVSGQMLQPLTVASNVAVLFAFGYTLGSIAFLFPGYRAVALALTGSVIYCIVAQWLFNNNQTWIPVFIPAVVQLPAALFIGLFWQYRVERRKEENVSRAIRYYIPKREAERIVSGGALTTQYDSVYATCLATDIQGYTSIAERLPPQELALLSNEYFGVLGKCIARRQGEMLDIVGDGMMCIWTAKRPNRDIRLGAALTAVDMQRAVAQFNTRYPQTPFPTRVGLNAGWVAMGNFGGGGHWVYGAKGDMVNTASRIEGLNKLLGTSLLAAKAVVDKLDELLVRRVGSFLLKGKVNTVAAYEIVAYIPEASEAQRDLCQRFTAALQAFDQRDWGRAHQRFTKLLEVHPYDGPSLYYKALCEQYRDTPAACPVDAPEIIRVGVK